MKGWSEVEGGEGEVVSMHSGDVGDKVPRSNNYGGETFYSGYEKAAEMINVVEGGGHTDDTNFEKGGEGTDNLNCGARAANGYGPKDGLGNDIHRTSNIISHGSLLFNEAVFSVQTGPSDISKGEGSLGPSPASPLSAKEHSQTGNGVNGEYSRKRSVSGDGGKDGGLAFRGKMKKKKG